MPICASSSLSSTLRLDSTEAHRSQTRREPEAHASESKTIRGSMAFSIMLGRVPSMNFSAFFSTEIEPNRAVFGTFSTVFRTFFDACLAKILDFESKSGFFAWQRPQRGFGPIRGQESLRESP